MFWLIEVVNQQNEFIKILETKVDTPYVSIKQLYPYEEPIDSNGTYRVNKVFNKLFDEYAPLNVIEKVKTNRALAKEKCEDRSKDEKLPFEYSKT